MMAVPTGNDAYFTAAKVRVRVSYQLWSARRLLSAVLSKYDHPDQAVSDPKFYALKDLVADLERQIN
jgi:hypothetical protein